MSQTEILLGDGPAYLLEPAPATDNFVEGKPGSPCPICHSQVAHRHMRSLTSSGAQWPKAWLVDDENQNPLTLREPVRPAWSHFHAEGNRVIDRHVEAARQELAPSVGPAKRDRYVGIPPERPRYRLLFKWVGKRTVLVGDTKIRAYQGWTTDYARHGRYVRGEGVPGVAVIEAQLVASVTGGKARRSVQLEDDYKGSDLSKPFDSTATVSVAKLHSKLRPWVRSQKHHDIDPNIKRLRTGRYKTFVRAGDYNSAEESYGESSDSSGVNAPISAHKTGKYYGGNASHPENGSNSTGWAGYVHTGGEHFEKREVVQSLQRYLVLEAGSEPYRFASVFRIVSEPADVSEARLDRPLIRQPMCPNNPSLPEKYCSHCQHNAAVLEPEPEQTEEEEPISDLEPDEFESAETDEVDEPADADDDESDVEDEVEDEAVEAIKAAEQDKPFEFVKRPYALDDPTPAEPEESATSGFASVNDLLKHKSTKPWRGRTPWWRAYWPGSVMLAPVYGYGRFVHPRPWYRDPNVSIAGERLIWAQVEELCKSSGLIWKEEQTVRYFDWRAYRRADESLKLKHSKGWRKRFMKSEQVTDWHGRSILNPDEAWRNETYIDTNPILRTTGAEDEKEKEQRAANLRAIDVMRGHPHATNQPMISVVRRLNDEDVLANMEGKMSTADVLARNPGATGETVKKRRHELRQLAKQNGNARARWMRALRNSNIGAEEPGIFVLAHFSRRKDRIYKIADAVDSDEVVWSKFHNLVMDLVQDRVRKNDCAPKADANLYRQRATAVGFEPPTDEDITIREIYWEYASELLTRLAWTVQPFAASQEPADHAFRLVCDAVAHWLYQAGFSLEELGFTITPAESSS